MTSGFSCVAAVLCLALAASARADDYLSREVARQAGFAREELAEGRCERALKSAESALRLDPSFHEALLLKASAYECAGELDLAVTNLRAVVEVAGEDLRRRAGQEIDRLALIRARRQAALGQQPLEGPALTMTLDPEPFKVRVVHALEAGHCSLALATAEELRRREPAEAEGWALLGDSLKCLGRNREAVRAYQGYEDAGGDDADKLAVRDKLRGSLGRIEVSLPEELEGAIPRFRLRVGGELVEMEQGRVDGALFVDLPADVPLSVEVDGRGLERTTVEVAALFPGEERTVRVAPAVVGLSTVEASAYDLEKVGAVTLLTSGEELHLPPGAREQVTAGELTVLVGGAEGAARFGLTVEPGERLTFDPTPYRPSTLSIGQVPAGAQIRVFVEGEAGVGIERLEDLPPQVGAIDPETGLRLADTRRYAGLVGGLALVALEHPRLGRWSAETALEQGGTNGLTVGLEALEGTAGITAAWVQWQTERDQARAALRQKAAATAVLSGLLLAAGAAATVAAAHPDLRQDQAVKSLACQLYADRGGFLEGDSEDACRLAAQARARQATLGIGGGAGLGLGVAGVGLSVSFGTRARRVLPASGDWDPWNVDTEPPRGGAED